MASKLYTVTWTYDADLWQSRHVDSMLDLPEDFWLAPIRHVAFCRTVSRAQILAQMEKDGMT